MKELIQDIEMDILIGKETLKSHPDAAYLSGNIVGLETALKRVKDYISKNTQKEGKVIL